ncbi:MAG: hypothetical protein Q8P02_00295, partial [Candidatus Micrarchaeota archaeon]|nr:hypothetical protein [Candidatus Micrarchaeota archaeon]
KPDRKHPPGQDGATCEHNKELAPGRRAVRLRGSANVVQEVGGAVVVCHRVVTEVRKQMIAEGAPKQSLVFSSVLFVEHKAACRPNSSSIIRIFTRRVKKRVARHNGNWYTVHENANQSFLEHQNAKNKKSSWCFCFWIVEQTQETTVVPTQPRKQRLWFFVGVTVASWAGILFLLFAARIERIPTARFPYRPILRSTVSLDDHDPFRPNLQALQTRGAAKRVAVGAFVAPIRTLVVSDDGTIEEMWSNTAGNFYHYSLLIRRSDRAGTPLPYSPFIHEQYANLLAYVDWSAAGRVYAVGDSRHKGLVPEASVAFGFR